jgi:hypothetical protein
MKCPKRPGVECESPMVCTNSRDEFRECLYGYGDQDGDQSNMLPDFHYQVREALGSLDEMDRFDLDSFNSSSVMMYRAIRKQYVEDALKLVDMIAADPVRLRQQLEALLKDH